MRSWYQLGVFIHNDTFVRLFLALSALRDLSRPRAQPAKTNDLQPRRGCEY